MTPPLDPSNSSVQIPRQLFELYDIAKESFTLYEQGERLQSVETAFQLRDVADHLIAGSRTSDPERSAFEFNQAAEHLAVICLDPLQRRTQERVIRLENILRDYRRHRLLHKLPEPQFIANILIVVDNDVQHVRRSKGRTDPLIARDCFEHMKRAYLLALDAERVLTTSLQTTSFSAQVILWILMFILTVGSLIITLITIL